MEFHFFLRIPALDVEFVDARQEFLLIRFQLDFGQSGQIQQIMGMGRVAVGAFHDYVFEIFFQGHMAAKKCVVVIFFCENIVGQF